MPVNLFRRHLPQLEGGGEYFVTEKTDGERKLLVVAEVAASSSSSSGGGGSASPPRAAAVGLLVDRSMRVSSVRGSSSSGGDGDGCFGGLPAGTVLDGEVVFNLTLQRHVFMVFDVLSLGYAAPAGGGSGCLVHLPWRQRVSQLPLAALAATQTASHPLPLGAKTFWPASKVDQLFKHMVAGNKGIQVLLSKSKSAEFAYLSSRPPLSQAAATRTRFASLPARAKRRRTWPRTTKRTA
jgi:hypothetical protein